MNRCTSILLMLLLALPVWAEFPAGWNPWTGPGEVVLTTSSTSSLTPKQAIEGSSDNWTITFQEIGTYTLNNCTPTADSLHLLGRGADYTTLTAVDTLIYAPDLHVFIENCTITSTGTGNALIGRIHLKNCVVKTTFQEFTDSTWAENTVFNSAGGEDSLAFAGYDSLSNCTILGRALAFGRVSTITAPVVASLWNCTGSSGVGALLHIPDENRNTTVRLHGGYYETWANAYAIGAANEAIVIMDGVTAVTHTVTAGTGNAAFYAHDSARIKLQGCTLLSKNQSTDLSQAFYSAYICTPDTVFVEACVGNNIAMIDSGNGAGDNPDANHSPPIRLYWRANSFEGESFSYTALEMKAQVVGSNAGQHYKFGDIYYYRDVTTGGYGSNPVWGIINTNGTNNQLVYPTGKIDQRGELYLKGTSGYITVDQDGPTTLRIIGTYVSGSDTVPVVQADCTYTAIADSVGGLR